MVLDCEGLWDACGLRPGVVGESWLHVTPLPLLTTSSEVACHDLHDPHDFYHQTASARSQRGQSDGPTQLKEFWENLKAMCLPLVAICNKSLLTASCENQ